MKRRSERHHSTPDGGVRVLVADDHEATRVLYVALLQQIEGVTEVVDAADGAEAVAIARCEPLGVAVLDLNMPQLDGVGAAVRIAALQPRAAIALHSSDPDTLEWRARDLRLPLFDKAEFDRLAAWVAAQVEHRVLGRPRRVRASSGAGSSGARPRSLESRPGRQ